ncbi:MAG: LysR family transcriptional regulator [Ruminococcaceae bacterium]|nr:LysR family transcriptional regulator [Oscillospiraceae bacterium]
MNTKQIQYALALSETLNFSQVAEQLGISQPAFSKQIQNIEKELGVKLFDRNHNPLTLTPAGEYFVRNARELLYKEEQLRKALDQFKTGESGRLTIGVTPFRSLYLMPGLIKKIRSRYPGVCVSLKEVPSHQLRKDVVEGKYDFAIINLPLDTSMLDVIPLEPDTLVLAVHNTLVEKLPIACDGEYPEVDFSEVKKLPFVVLSQNQELRQLFDKLCTRADFHPNIAAEVMGVTSAFTMAQAGVGATLLPLQFVHNQHFDKNLSIYIVKNSIFSRQPVIVTRRGQFRSPYADFAIHLLTAEQN